MAKVLVPKISNRNVAKLNDTENYDYLLGNYNDTNILDYSGAVNKQVDFIDKTNDFEYNSFKYLSTVFSSNYYIQKCCSVNTGIASILKAISPHFSLIQDDINKNKFIVDLLKTLAIEIDEKGLFKKLHCGHYKLKRKEILKALIDTKDFDIYQVFKYLALRFNFGLTVIEDDTFHNIFEPINRKIVVLLKNDRSYYLLCSKSGDSTLFTQNEVKYWISKVKLNLFKLEDIHKYKVDDLRDISKKNNIDISGCNKKDEIYEKIKSWLVS